MKKVILISMLLILVCSFAAVAIGQQGSAWISPASQQVVLNSPAVVTIGANPGSTSVSTVNMEVTFDTNKLSITKDKITQQLQGWTFTNSVVGDKIKIKGYTLDPSLFFQGNTNIATLAFTATGEGNAVLTLTTALLNQGKVAITTKENGAITVVQQQAPQCVDNDKDGYGTTNCGKGLDCNDNILGINPGAVEVCNNVDDNCNNQVDESFDKTADENNCGACGNVCAAGQVCTAGKCVELEQPQPPPPGPPAPEAQQDNQALLDAISNILKGQGTSLDKLASIAAELFKIFK